MIPGKPITLRGFIEESNAIEAIYKVPSENELKAHEALINCDYLDIAKVEEFVWIVAGVPIRDKPGMNVYVGNHTPPPGGPEIESALGDLLSKINKLELLPFTAHNAYETLHPFCDGNGRSGRAIWAHSMLKHGLDPFQIPFLQRIYYQALDLSDGRLVD